MIRKRNNSTYAWFSSTVDSDAYTVPAGDCIMLCLSDTSDDEDYATSSSSDVRPNHHLLSSQSTACWRPPPKPLKSCSVALLLSRLLCRASSKATGSTHCGWWTKTRCRSEGSGRRGRPDNQPRSRGEAVRPRLLLLSPQTRHNSLPPRPHHRQPAQIPPAHRLLQFTELSPGLTAW